MAAGIDLAVLGPILQMHSGSVSRWANHMQPMSRFKATDPTQLERLISDLSRRVQLLDADIQEEERRAYVFDPAQPDYPILALTLRARRDNLLASITTLETRLKTSDRLGSWDQSECPQTTGGPVSVASIRTGARLERRAISRVCRIPFGS